MSALYLRLAAYLLAIILLIALGWWIGASHWKARYESLEAGDAQARADAMAKAIAQIQAQDAAYDAHLKEVLHDRDTQVAAATTHADELAHSLQHYQDNLRACAVPPGPGPASGAHAPAPEPGRDGAITSATRAVLEACASDAEQLRALQAERQSVARF